MDETELREAFGRVVAGEPALRLSADEVVAGGLVRRRRRRAFTGSGVALAAAAMAAVPALLLGGGPGGVPAASGTTPGVPPTPGAPHGGCSGFSKSESPLARAFGDWLPGHLPANHRYATPPGTQNEYGSDCVDGSHSDALSAAAEIVGRPESVRVNLTRNTPAQPVVPPCVRTTPTVSYTTLSPPAGGPTSADPTSAAPTSARAPAGTTGSQVLAGAPDGSWYDIQHPTYGPCQSSRRPDGSTLTVEGARYNVVGQDGKPTGKVVHERTVALWRPEGTVIQVAQTGPAVAPGGGDGLSLSRDQLVALATNPAVLLYVPVAR